MRQPKYKYFEVAYDGGKVPRKIKKYFLGKRISSSALRRLLKTVKLVLYKDKNRPSYPIIQFHPYAFCPKCGCQEQRSVYRPGYWPEVYNSYYCLRCGALVAWEDNSPYTHTLEEYFYDEYERQTANGTDSLPEYPEQPYEITDDFSFDI